MAKCPQCATSQDWWQLLKLDRTRLLVCWRCGAILAIEPTRAVILVGGFIALAFFPESGLLPFDANPVWFFAVFAVYLPFYLSYMKLSVVSAQQLATTPSQQQAFAAYAKARRRNERLGKILVLGGLLLFSVPIFVTTPEKGVGMVVAGLFAVITGICLLSFTRCPFCKQISVRMPFAKNGRCIHCHKDLDIGEAA